MKNTLEYKGYQAKVEFSVEDDVLFGELSGINDLVTFEGDNVQELKQAFHDAVDEYLELCKQQGKTPEKAYKGSFNVRIKPETHRLAARKAEALGISLNEFVEKAITSQVNDEAPSKNEVVSGVRSYPEVIYGGSYVKRTEVLQVKPRKQKVVSIKTKSGRGKGSDPEDRRAKDSDREDRRYASKKG
jgi:predicted HicB family RNase H-like nuclease